MPTSVPRPPDASPDSDLISVRVTERRSLTERVDEFTVSTTDTSALPDWAAGSHIDVHTPGGAIRQYSLLPQTTDTASYRVAVDRRDAGRGGSISLHRDVSIGTTLRISQPRNHFALTRALRYVFVAGGIGITPILSLVEQAEHLNRPWSLIYLGPHRTLMPYADELADRYGDRVVTHTSATSGRTDISRHLAGLEPGTAVYTCGPDSLLTDVEIACTPQHAVDAFAERFVAADREPARDEPFEVSLALSGRTVEVPAGRSILDVLDDAGIVTVSSCREGVCGTCEAEVVSGEVEHRDSVLTPAERAENETMMVCVSRCTSGRLVLDL